MRVLVTGGTGFVGSHVIRTLFGRADRPTPWEVYVLTREKLQSGDELRERIQESLGHATLAPGAEGHLHAIPGDIEDASDVEGALETSRAELVFHLAGVYAWWQPDKGRFDRVNVDGVRHLVAACAAASWRPKLVHVSTVLAYGNPEGMGLTPETAFNEETPVGETASLYARSKQAGDGLAQEAFAGGRVAGCTCFLACCIGRDPKLIRPDQDVMKMRALVDGKVPAVIASHTTFTYVYIRDAAEAIVRAGERMLGGGGGGDPPRRGERYLIGNQRLQTGDFYDLIAELSGTPRPTREVPAWVAFGWGHLTAFTASNLTGANPTAPADIVRTATKGTLLFDAGKSERELGMEYTDIRVAFREAVDFIKAN